jgi:hypothetical protein
MKPPAPPELAPEISDQIVRGVLSAQEERNKIEAWREERRKRVLVGAVLLLLFVFVVLFFRR